MGVGELTGRRPDPPIALNSPACKNESDVNRLTGTCNRQTVGPFQIAGKTLGLGLEHLLEFPLFVKAPNDALGCRQIGKNVHRTGMEPDGRGPPDAFPGVEEIPLGAQHLNPVILTVSQIDASLLVSSEGMGGVKLHGTFSSEPPGPLKLSKFVKKKTPPVDRPVGDDYGTVGEYDDIGGQVKTVGRTREFKQSRPVLIELENAFQPGVDDPDAAVRIDGDLVRQHECISPPRVLDAARFRVEHKDGWLADELLEETGLRVHMIFTVIERQKAPV